MEHEILGFFQGLPGKRGVEGKTGIPGPKVSYTIYSFRYFKCDLSSCRDPVTDLMTSLCATQGSGGEKGTLGLPGIKGDMVGFHYVLHPVGIVNVVKHI